MSDKTLELPDGMDLDTARDILAEFHTTDDAQIVSADVLSSYEDNIEELSGVFRDALKNQKDLPDEAVEGMTVDALTAPFRNDEGDIEADTLSQEPETQAGDGDSSPETDTLSSEDKETIRENLRRADLLEDRTPDHADTLRSEAADLAGVDDASEIEVDAL